MKRVAGILIGAAAVWAALGCAREERGPASRAWMDDAASSDVVLPSTALMEMGLTMNGSGWETSRNDPALGVDGSPGKVSVHLLEIRSVDRRWTINGRVRESSHTTTRTTQRAVVRPE
jgi:hypothetical protein